VKKLVDFYKRLQLPKNWLTMLLISGTVFGISQWVTRYTEGPTTVFFRFLRFGVANFYATLVIDLAGVFIFLGCGIFSFGLCTIVKHRLGEPSARSRVGRGLQRLLWRVLIVATCLAGSYIPLYGLINRPWLGSTFAVLVMQYPLHAVWQSGKKIFDRVRPRSFKPRNIPKSILRFLSRAKRMAGSIWRYFFFDSSRTDYEFAPDDEWFRESTEPKSSSNFANIFLEFLERPTSLWRQWHSDVDHRYAELEEALEVVRRSPFGLEALEQAGPGFQLVAEIKHEDAGYRLMALTVLPMSQVLQPDIQYCVTSIPTEEVDA
jgi:hypothetical protein